MKRTILILGTLPPTYTISQLGTKELKSGLPC